MRCQENHEANHQRPHLSARHREEHPGVPITIFSSVPLSKRPLSRASRLHTRRHHAALYERTESPPRASHPPQRPHREVRQRPREAPRPHRSLQRLRRLHHPHRPQPPTRLRLRRPRRRTQRRAPGRF